MKIQELLHQFRWFEKGLQFQVQFIKKDFIKTEDISAFEEELGTDLGPSWDQAGTKLALSWHQVGTKLALSSEQVGQLFVFCEVARTIQEMMDVLDWKDRTKFRNKYIKPLLELNLLAMTIPDKPSSPNQKYFLIEQGKALLIKLNK